MKKLVYPFLFLLVAACNRENSPVPNPSPDARILAKHQAPFGTAVSDVKVKQVILQNRLAVEYVYEGDVMRSQNLLDETGTKITQKGTFVRLDGLPQTYTAENAGYGMSGDSAVSFKRLYSLAYTAPKDSIRQVQYQSVYGNIGSIVTYAFDKSGFITKQEFFGDLRGNIAEITRYIRNAQHNVAQSWTSATGSKPDSWGEYEYDSHPNPFFKLGRDWGGDLSVRSLSPNNLTKETYKNSIGETSNIYYSYEYLPNGYPKKVTIRVVSVNYLPYSYDVVFVY